MHTTQRRLLVGLFIPLGVGLIFILPWFVPQSGPIVSDSYTFGFSNAAADLGVLAMLAALFFWRYKDGGCANQQEAFFDLLAAPPRPKTNHRLFWPATFAVTLFAAATAGGWWWYLPKAYFGESAYFLTRLDRMLMGEAPYGDFDFGYGPWMLDAPFYLHKLGAGRLGIDTSYILCLLVFFVLGMLALADVVRSLALSEKLKALLILAFGVAGANISLGILYTPLRYILPLWAVIVHQRQVRRDIAEGDTLSLSQIALAFALPFAGFCICPDTGVVTLFAMVAGCLWFWRTSWRAPMLGALAAAASAGMVAHLYGPDYFRMFLLFGGGAYNFPIVPAPYILVFLGCVFYLLPDLGVIALDEEGAEAPLFAAVLVALGLFIPSALGRCDPGHVFENGLGILVLAAAGLVASPSPARRGIFVFGAILLFGTMEVASWNNGKPALDYVLHLRKQAREGGFTPIAKTGKSDIFDWSKQTPIPQWMLDGLAGYDKVGLPLGGGEDVDRYLKISGKYVSEYFVPPYGGTFTEQSLRRKLLNLDRMDVILVPRIYFRHLQPFDKEAYAKSACALMQGLFLFPVHLAVLNEPLEPEAIVVRRIARDFLPVTKFQDYVLLRRKTSP